MSSISTVSDLRAWLCPFGNTNSHQPAPYQSYHQQRRNKASACSTTTNSNNHQQPSIPYLKRPFIALATEESRHIPAIQSGFQSYAAALELHQPFSQSFLAAECASTTQAIQQLTHLRYIFDDLIARANLLGCGRGGGCGYGSGAAAAADDVQSEASDDSDKTALSDSLSVSSGIDSSSDEDDDNYDDEADDEIVPEEMCAELDLAWSWVLKHRASLVSCHVFFKINFSLAREKPNDGIVELVDCGGGGGQEEERKELDLSDQHDLSLTQAQID